MVKTILLECTIPFIGSFKAERVAITLALRPADVDLTIFFSLNIIFQHFHNNFSLTTQSNYQHGWRRHGRSRICHKFVLSCFVALFYVVIVVVIMSKIE